MSRRRKLRQRILRALGDHTDGRFETTVAPSLVEALTGEAGPGAVILDLHDPGSGQADLRTLAGATGDTPVVVVADTQGQSLEAMRLGATDHLSQTASFKVLLPRMVSHAVEQAEARRLVRASDARLAGLFSNSPLAVEEYDEEGTLVRVNEAAKATFGIVEDLPSYNLFDSPYLRQGVRRSLEAGQIYSGEIVFTPDFTAIRSSNEQPVWLSATIFPTVDSTGAHTGHFAIYEDVTARKAVERDLEDRVAHEGALSAISSLFLDLEPGDVEEATNKALELLSKFAGADYALIFQVHGGGANFSLVHGWDALDEASPRLGWRTRRTADFPWLFDLISTVGTARCDSLGSLPEGAAAERSALQAAGLRAMVVAGIRREGCLEGLICLGTSDRKRPFPESALHLAQLVGEIAAGANARARAEREAADLRRSLLHAREDERARVARAIHDELGSRLTGVRYDLGWVSRRVEQGEALQAKVDQTAAEVDDILRSVRRLASDLRPSLLDDLGLVAALEWLAETWEGSTRVHCRLDLQPRLDELGKARSLAVFRVVQEALTNIARHAGGPDLVTVSCVRKAATLTLEITDNGQGFDSELVGGGGGMGLAGMKERAVMAGGSLRVSSRPGRGTTVLLTLPDGGSG